MDNFVQRLFASDMEGLDTRTCGRERSVHMFRASCPLKGLGPHGTYAALVFNLSASRTHCCGAATPIACPANSTPYAIWCSKVSSRTISASSHCAKPYQRVAIHLLQFWLSGREWSLLRSSHRSSYLSMMHYSVIFWKQERPCKVRSSLLAYTCNSFRGVIGRPETSVRNYHHTLRNIPDERRSILHVFCGGSLKSSCTQRSGTTLSGP